MSRGSGLPWFAGTAQQCLDTLKFVHGDHGWMLARKALAFPLQNSSIEGIGEKVIKRTQGDGLAANTFAAHGSQSPLACCNFPNTAGRDDDPAAIEPRHACGARTLRGRRDPRVASSCLTACQ